MVQAGKHTPRGRALALPPYVSYATFRRFLDSLKQALPSRIDRSVLGWFSPAAQAQLLLALRFLGLTGEKGQATERLEDLAAAQGPLRQKLLRETVAGAYRQVVGGLNLQSATNGQLEEQFRKTGASGVTLRKCVAFFVSAMDDAGIAHSPYTAKRRAGRPIGARSAKSEAGNNEAEKSSTTNPPNDYTAGPRTDDISMVVLINKFPAFDQGWSDEVKTKWFEAFQYLAQLQRPDRKPSS